MSARQRGPAKRRAAFGITVSLFIVTSAVALIWVRSRPLEPVPAPELGGVENAVARKIHDVTAAVRRAPRSAAAWGTLALTLDAHAFREEAVRAYRVAADLDSDDFRWPYLGGIVLHQLNASEAVAWFERAHAIRPDYAPLLVNYGHSLFAGGRFREAERAYERALEANTRDPSAVLGLAQIAVVQDQLPMARRYLEQALERFPQHGEMHALLSEVYRRLGMTDQASRERQLADRAPTLVPFTDPAYSNVIREGVGSFWALRRGEAYLIRGRFDSAAVEFATAVEARPDAESHTRLGLALQLLGQHDQAAMEYRAALALRPAHPAALRQLGTVLVELGQATEGIAYLHRARERAPHVPDTYLALYRAYAALGQWSDAVSALRQGLQTMPDEARLTTRLAWALATAPDPSVRNGNEAIRLAETVTSLTGDGTAEVLDALAAGYAETGRYDRAVATAQRALELAVAAGRMELASQIESHLRSYRARHPWRDRPA